MKCYSGPYSGRTSLRDLGGWLARGAAWWVTAQMVVGAGDIRFTEVIDGAPVVVNRQLLGAAWGDFDDDGRVDLYGAGVDSGPGELFRNTAARFVRVEEGVVATDSWRRAGAAWGDYDNDGWPDLLVVGATADPLAVYHNLGGKGFAKLGTVSGFTPAVGMSGIWVDYDNDGWLDFFCVNGGGAQGQPNGLYHNDGQGGFVRVTKGTVATEAKYSHGAAFGDFDGDGDLDLLVTQAWNQKDSLFRNDGNGVFTPITVADIGANSPNAGGTLPVWADYDNDGDLDLVIVTGSTRNRQYRNDGDGRLTAVTQGPIPESGGDAAGAVFADFDNDGWLDLLMTRRSGQYLLFQGIGGGGFREVTEGEVPNRRLGANGVAVADYDGDGALDVYFANWPEPSGAALFRNVSTGGNHWLRVRLQGTISNRSGIGAKVRVLRRTAKGDSWQMRQIGGFDSAGSQESVAHFGMGESTNAVSVRVEWPSGITQTVEGVNADQVLTVVESPVTVAGPPRFNRQTGLYEQELALDRQGGPAGSGVRVIATGLPAGVTLVNAAGIGASGPFVQVERGGTNTGPLKLTLAYLQPNRQGVASPTYRVEYGDWGAELPETGERFAILRALPLDTGGVLVEFASVAGAKYAIEYSEDLGEWLVVPGVVTAGGTRTQWLDQGPPATRSLPEAGRQRYYRVVKHVEAP